MPLDHPILIRLQEYDESIDSLIEDSFTWIGPLWSDRRNLGSSESIIGIGIPDIMYGPQFVNDFSYEYVIRWREDLEGVNASQLAVFDPPTETPGAGPGQFVDSIAVSDARRRFMILAISVERHIAKPDESEFVEETE